MRRMRQRRSQQQWAEIVEQQSVSEQSIEAFCEANDIGLASFGKWKRRILNGDLPSQGSTPGAFKPMQLVAATESGVAATPDTTITLSLGPHITLKIETLGPGA